MRLAALFALAALLACTPETDAPADPSAAAAGDGLATRDLFTYGAEQDSAIEIAPGIFQSLGTGNAQMVVTSEGNVVFDTGLSNQPEVQERLRAADPGPAGTSSSATPTPTTTAPSTPSRGKTPRSGPTPNSSTTSAT